MMILSKATRNRISPPAMASIGSGIPKLFNTLLPINAATVRATIEKRTALNASCLLNFGFECIVICANGTTSLNGPSIRKRKVNICAVSIMSGE